MKVNEIFCSLQGEGAWNYKTEATDEVLNKLINSITYQKSLGVLAVREIGKDKYEVIDGNHRLEAIKRMGIDKMQVENFGKISKAEAVLISKQRNTIWFEDDNLMFAELFKEELLKEFSAEELEQLLPYSKEEIEGYEKLLDFDWGQYEKNDNDVIIENKFFIKLEVDEVVMKQWEKLKEYYKEKYGDANDYDCFHRLLADTLKDKSGIT